MSESNNVNKNINLVIKGDDQFSPILDGLSNNFKKVLSDNSNDLDKVNKSALDLGKTFIKMKDDINKGKDSTKSYLDSVLSDITNENSKLTKLQSDLNDKQIQIQALVAKRDNAEKAFKDTKTNNITNGLHDDLRRAEIEYRQSSARLTKSILAQTADKRLNPDNETNRRIYASDRKDREKENQIAEKKLESIKNSSGFANEEKYKNETENLNKQIESLKPAFNKVKDEISLIDNTIGKLTGISKGKDSQINDFNNKLATLNIVTDNLVHSFKEAGASSEQVELLYGKVASNIKISENLTQSSNKLDNDINNAKAKISNDLKAQQSKASDSVKLASKKVDVEQSEIDAMLASVYSIELATRQREKSLLRIEELRKDNRISDTDANKLVKQANDRFANNEAASSGRKALHGASTAYKLQDTSYQLYDIFDQTVSGTNFWRAVAIQAPQILQDYQTKLINRIVAINAEATDKIKGIVSPNATGGFWVKVFEYVNRVKMAIGEAYKASKLFTLSGLAIGAIGAYKAIKFVITGMYNLYERYKAVDEISARISARSDTMYNTKSIINYVDNVHKLGVAISDASKAMQQLMEQNIDSSKFEQITYFAQNISKISGQDFSTSFTELTTALNDGVDGMEKLDDKYRLLTSTQRLHIDSMVEEGKYAEALNEINNQMSENIIINNAKNVEAMGGLRATYEALGIVIGQIFSGTFKTVHSSLQGLFDVIAEGYKFVNNIGERLFNGTKASLKELLSLYDSVYNTIHNLSYSAIDNATGRPYTVYKAGASRKSEEFEENTGTYSDFIDNEKSLIISHRLDEQRKALASINNNPLQNVNSNPARERENLSKVDDSIDERYGSSRSGSGSGSYEGLRGSGVLADLKVATVNMKDITDVMKKGLHSFLYDNKDNKKLIQGAGGNVEEQQKIVQKLTDTYNKNFNSDYNRLLESRDKSEQEAIKQFNNSVIQAEGYTGKNSKENTLSSAKGYGQFLRSTAISYAKKAGYSGSDDELAGLRYNKESMENIISNVYTPDLANSLRNNNHAVTLRNLAVYQTYGAGGGNYLLNNPNAPIADARKALGATAINNNWYSKRANSVSDILDSIDQHYNHILNSDNKENKVDTIRDRSHDEVNNRVESYTFDNNAEALRMRMEQSRSPFEYATLKAQSDDKVKSFQSDIDKIRNDPNVALTEQGRGDIARLEDLKNQRQSLVFQEAFNEKLEQSKKISDEIAKNNSDELQKQQDINDKLDNKNKILTDAEILSMRQNAYAKEMQKQLDDYNAKVKSAPAGAFVDQFDSVTANEIANRVANNEQRRLTQERDNLVVEQNKKQLAGLESNLNDKVSLRTAFESTERTTRRNGQFGIASEYQGKISNLNEEIQKASDSYGELLDKIIAGGPEMAKSFGITITDAVNMKDKIDAIKPATDDLTKQFLLTGRAINEQLGEGASSVLGSFIEKINEGKTVTQSLKESFQNFLASFAQSQAQTLAKQLMYNLVGGSSKDPNTGEAGGGGLGSLLSSVEGGNTKQIGNSASSLFGAIGSLFGGSSGDSSASSAVAGATKSVAGASAGGVLFNWISSLFHNGTSSHQGLTRTNINPSIFDGAVRYHTGGIAGYTPNSQLAKNELPAILKRGEEVLTENDPRHRNNYNGNQQVNQGSTNNITVTMVNSHNEALRSSLSSPAGAKHMMSFMKNNSQQIKGLLG